MGDIPYEAKTSSFTGASKSHSNGGDGEMHCMNGVLEVWIIYSSLKFIADFLLIVQFIFFNFYLTSPGGGDGNKAFTRQKVFAKPVEGICR